MATLVKTVQNGAISKKNATTMGYYVIQKKSESYTLQEDKACNVQIRTSGDLVVKVQ